MSFNTGDIADLYEWSDENSERGNASIAKDTDETHVGGTQASFEQLLERELAKEQALGGPANAGAGKRRSGAGGTKPRQSFLRKGSRGWWMENPDAKHKMHKHELISVEIDGGSQERQKAPRAVKAPAAKSKAATRPSASAENRDHHSASPEPTRRVKEPSLVDISPARVPSARSQPREAPPVEDVMRSLPLWASQAEQNGVRIRDSVDTALSMSGVRQEFQARIEQEADELADFEALERELAAEKSSYMREKQREQYDQHAYDSFSGFEEDEKASVHFPSARGDYDASWLRESGDEPDSFQDEASYPAAPHHFRRSSDSSLDLGGESSLVFDGDHHVFQSPQLQRGPSRSRPSFAPSEISAVSVNESEPWGEDGHALDHFSRLPESPIAKHGMTSVLLNPSDDDARSAPSFSSSSHRDFLWAGKGEDRAQEDEDHVQDSLVHYSKYDSVDHSSRRMSSRRDSDAPVSSLVQQVFGGARADTEDDEHEGAQISTPPRRSTMEKDKSSGKPVKAKASMKKVNGRVQSASDDTKTAPRRRSPKFSATGALPVAVEEKLAELEEEVRFYKSETLQLQKKKAQFDDELSKLARQKEAIVSFEDEQRRLMEQEWEQERQKMKREERMFERQMKVKLSAAGSAASRKDRAEIDSLKAQIVKLQLDAKQTSSKTKATNDALRQRIAELEGKNREQSEEIKFLEKDRLDQWQRYEELLKELNSHKQKSNNGDKDGLKTVHDVSRIGRTAEQLMNSLGLHTATSSSSSPSEYPVSTASTPTYAHEDTYNPGRYRNANFFTQPRDTSLFGGRDNGGNVRDEADRDNQDDDDLDQREDDEQDQEVTNEVVHPGGKREITYRDGAKKIYFADGNEKEIQPDGHVLIRFTNGDRKEYFPSTGISVYHYFEAQTKLTTYPDKTKVYEFPNQQTEKSYPDGRTEIQFADGIRKIIHPHGDEVSTFPDGTTMLENKNGMREVTLLNGKKVRYYPNGSMALVSVDGQERKVRSEDELKELMESLG